MSPTIQVGLLNPTIIPNADDLTELKWWMSRSSTDPTEVPAVINCYFASGVSGL
jgi:hypothetical protein